LINVAQLTAQYYVLKPEAGNAEHAVKFGTSGHRGSAGRHNFNEQHILAIAQAIAEDRVKNGITGPATWVKIPTRSPNRPLFPYWKCWRPTALMLSCRKTTVSPDAGHFQCHPGAQQKRWSAGGRHRDHAVS
jgi:hypothetical protein